MKRDAFVLMDLDTEEFTEAYGCQSNILIFQKNNETEKFISEWLYYCENYNIITDAPNSCGKENYPEYDPANDRLSDMKVLCLLKEKYKIETFRNPNQYGDIWKIKELRESTDFFENESKSYDEPNISYNSPYPTIFLWEKSGIDLKRPLSHLMNPKKLFYIIYRKITKQ